MPLTLHGLKNCDTCRKALKALAAAHIDVTFNDVRADGVTKAQIKRWVDATGWETLLNTRSSTWRGLDEGEKADKTLAKAVALMTAHPALIKRPVIEADGEIYVGWTKETIAQLISG